MSTQMLIILNEAPYGQERSFHGLRLADALLMIEDDLDLTVYLTTPGQGPLRGDGAGVQKLQGAGAVPGAELAREARAYASSKAKS